MRTMLLLFGLVASGCASDDDAVGTEERTDVVHSDGPVASADAESTTTTTANSDHADSTATSSESTVSDRPDFECPGTTTTTSVSALTGLPSVCELIEAIPADELPSEGVGDYDVWSGTISGSIQTPGCEAASQSGQIILVVFSDGDLAGAGETVAGAYGCENGAAIPEMTRSYGIDGRMTDVFTLTFTDGVQLSSEPIESGHALITQDTGYGRVTIELTCENC